jgi:hypothetical protein
MGPTQTPFNDDQVFNTAYQPWPSKKEKRDSGEKSQSAKKILKKKIPPTIQPPL